MTAISAQINFKNPTVNFPKFSSYCVCSHYTQTMDMVAIVIIIAELLELQLHFDPVIDSLYITTTCRVCLYIFFHRDFVVSLFSLLFNPAAPFLVIPLHMTHSAAPLIPPPTSPSQVVPSLSSDGDPSEAADSSSSPSSTLDYGYAPADLGMVNGLLSSESIQRSHPASRLQYIM